MRSLSKGSDGLNSTDLAGIKDRGLLLELCRILLPGPRRIVVDVRYGMTNRMRAYASARALAKAAGRPLTVVWEADAHARARMRDLFVPPVGVFVIEDGAGFRDILARAPVASEFALHNLMDPAQKHASVDPNVSKHVYVNSAFTINSPVPYQEGGIIALR
jgi:hypothetical protein